MTLGHMVEEAIEVRGAKVKCDFLFDFYGEPINLINPLPSSLCFLLACTGVVF